MDWNEMKARQVKEPSRFTRILNGDDDKIRGYDDGEVPSSDRPKSYYAEDINSSDEVENAVALQGTNLY
jgi:hypothetical protein